MLARRAKREGWSLFPVYSNASDMSSPLTHFYVTNNCADYPGWSCDASVTSLLKAFARAETLQERKTIAAEIQATEYETVPSVMWGQFAIPVGYRTRVKNLIPSAFPMLWNLEIAGA